MRWFLVGVSVALLVGACGSDEPSGTTDGTRVETTTSETPATTEASTTVPATTEALATTAPEAGGGPACVAGVWELDSAAFMEQIFAAYGAEMEGVDAFEFVSGSQVVTLGADGSYVSERDEWSFRIGTGEDTVRMTIDGTDVGSYTITGDEITITDLDQSAVMSLQAEVDGQLLDLPIGTVGNVEADVLLGTASYTCSGDLLTVTADEPGVTAVFERVG